MDENIAKDGAEFIVAYYTAMAYKELDLAKFYDDSALIDRPDFSNPLPLSKALNQIQIAPNNNSTINVISKSIMPNSGNLAILITGSIVTNSNERRFTQMFVLHYKCERLYIMTDAVQYADPYINHSNFEVLA